jgi:hypothetical protein
MERHEAGSDRIIPIILQPVVWEATPFRGIFALLRDGRPITTWSNRHQALMNVAVGIQTAVNEVLQRRL